MDLQLSLHQCSFEPFYPRPGCFRCCCLYALVCCQTFGGNVANCICSVTCIKAQRLEHWENTHTHTFLCCADTVGNQTEGKGCVELVVTSPCVTLGFVIVDLIVFCFVYPGFCHLMMIMMMMTTTTTIIIIRTCIYAQFITTKLHNMHYTRQT